MRGTRVLAGATVVAAMATVAPPALATTTATVGGAELTVTGSAAGDVITVTLPGDALAPPTADTPYEITDPTGVNWAGGSQAGPSWVGGTPAEQAGCTRQQRPQVDPVTGAPTGATDPVTGQPIMEDDPTKVRCERGAAPRPALNDFVVSIDGGGGDDTIRSVAPLTVGDAVSTGDRSFISGGAGNDTISGSENDDVVSGDAGNDVIDGDGGNDILSGWIVPVIADPFAAGLKVAEIDYYTGAIASVGAAGNDSVFGGGGADIVTDGDNAAETADVLSGFKCAPGLVIGGAACPATSLSNVDVPEEDFDELFWGHRTSAQPVSVDTQLAGATQGVSGENETIVGMRGVYGGAGNDVLSGHDADVGNILSGNDGNDQLDGRGGNDELLGGDGIDTITGGAGGDVINPGGHISSSTATSTSIVSDGADIVDGGADGLTATDGVDLITYAGRSDNLTLNLTAGTGWGAAGENDQVTGVENVTGGHGADMITARSGVPAVIESDPIAPEAPHAGEPVLPSPPPGGYFANDTIHVRNGAADTVDCGGDAIDPDADSVVADRAPADAIALNCESVDLPPLPPSPPPQPSGGGSGSAPPGKTGAIGGAGSSPRTGTRTTPTLARISGGRSAGRTRVSRAGSFRLRRHVIACPARARCSVRVSVTVRLSGAAARKARLKKTRRASKRTYKLGGSNYTIRAGRSAVVRAKLSKKGLQALKRLKRARVTVSVRAVHRGRPTSKKVTVTLLAPASRRDAVATRE